MKTNHGNHAYLSLLHDLYLYLRGLTCRERFHLQQSQQLTSLSLETSMQGFGVLILMLMQVVELPYHR